MSSLLDAFKLVYSAVDNKSAIGEFSHFAVENKQLRASNGAMSIGTPIDLDFTCYPHAETLIKALRSCSDVVTLSMTDGGRLRVGSGKFRAFVPCLQSDSSFYGKPSGSEIDIEGEKLYKAFEVLAPFVATDGFRPWANGILLKGQSAYATNNICAIEYWLGVELPFITNIPLAAIKVLLSRKLAPTRMLMDPNSVTFFYESGTWIKAQLYDVEWPDLSRLFNQQSKQRAIPEGFYEGLAALSKFTDDGRVYFRDGSMCTAPANHEGAMYEVEGLPERGIYKTDAVQLLKGVATTADFDRYPDNALFFGDAVRGVVMGLRE